MFNTDAPALQDNSALPDIALPADPDAPLTSSSPASHYSRFMNIFRAEGRVTDNLMYECASLGVSSLALAAVASGYYPIQANAACPSKRIPKAETAGGDYLALPVRDTDASIIGIQLIQYTGHSVLTVGKPGLIFPCSGYDYPGIVVVSHSALDVLALLSVGICAVAVTDPEGDVEILYKWLQRLGEERGVYIVGKDTWSKRLTMGLLENDLKWVWRADPPDGCANLHDWLATRLAKVKSNKGLERLGNLLAGNLESNGYDPCLNSTAPRVTSTTTLPLPLTGPVVDVLMCHPSHWQFLSESARNRGRIDQREHAVAVEAECAARNSDVDAVTRWKAEGVRISAIIDAKQAGFAAALALALDPTVQCVRTQVEPTPTPNVSALPKRFDRFSNFTLAADGVQLGLSSRYLTRILLTATGGWPRRVERMLFATDNSGGQLAPLWLDKPDDLFGWISGQGDEINNSVNWVQKQGMVTKAEMDAYLRQAAESYDAVESFPHQPSLPRHYYLHPSPQGGDGKALAEFLDCFSPATSLDRELMKAALMTVVWGGPSGQRPAFLITTDEEEKRDDQKGRGSGKTTFARMAAALVGGYMDIRPTYEVEAIMKRLLSPGARGQRVVLIDNIKSHRFSWDDLENLITASVLSGHQMFQGEGRRPNTLVWFLTLNGASLSKDMAQRVITIKVTRPEYSEGWEAKTTSLIESRRWEIIGDLVAELQRPTAKLKRYTRWSVWDQDVLARLNDPDACQELIGARREDVDDDKAEAEIVRDYFVAELRRRGHESDRETIFITSAIAAKLVNDATGERRPTPRATTYLGTLHIGELRKSNRAQTRGWVWKGMDAPQDEKALPIKLSIEEVVKNIGMPPPVKPTAKAPEPPPDFDDLFR